KIAKKLNKKNFLNILDKHLLSGIEVSKPVSRILSKHQSSKMKSKEEIADNIAHLIISIPEITIGEISRQIGHAAGILGYDSSLLDTNIDTSKKISDWFALSVEPIIIGANETYKIFKK
ncbi:hypothetical protein ACFGPM_003742, partial [Salmonella enterica]|nr:hypothetical protein [Salmonella enterica subsp. enterica serovar Senftenberg]EBL9962220.1 hypothetical protein [Salmonella enterica]EKQ8828763.1 hypothetical protein [Salmonella enterica subsp. enterica serovar Senftenberg]HEB3108321.1 hypothetical protein [Salmonella enterica subsp. enterica serovar Senftenberg]